MTSIEFLEQNVTLNISVYDWLLLIQQAKEMHKREIVKAFDESENYYYQYLINHAPKLDSETYYQETFKKKQ